MVEVIPDLIVLRHGQTEWNLARRWQGGLDSALTPLGQRQALGLASMFARLSLGHGTHLVFTSPQGRAVTTARLVFGPGATEIADLREIGMGDWTGRLRADTLRDAGLSADPDMMSIYKAAPGGEGFAALEARCRKFLSRLDGPSVAVTHGVTGRMIRALAQGLPVAALQDLAGGQGVAYRIRNGVETRLMPDIADHAPP